MDRVESEFTYFINILWFYTKFTAALRVRIHAAKTFTTARYVFCCQISVLEDVGKRNWCTICSYLSSEAYLNPKQTYTYALTLVLGLSHVCRCTQYRGLDKIIVFSSNISSDGSFENSLALNYILTFSLTNVSLKLFCKQLESALFFENTFFTTQHTEMNLLYWIEDFTYKLTEPHSTL